MTSLPNHINCHSCVSRESRKCWFSFDIAPPPPALMHWHFSQNVITTLNKKKGNHSSLQLHSHATPYLTFWDVVVSHLFTFEIIELDMECLAALMHEGTDKMLSLSQGGRLYAHGVRPDKPIQWRPHSSLLDLHSCLYSILSWAVVACLISLT